MVKKGILLFSFMILLLQSLTAQLKYANLLFEEQNYVEAIPLYERIIQKKGESKEVVENLAYCYKVINDYNNAEKYYAKAVALDDPSPKSYLYYGQLLKSSNKINQAREQFITYNKINPGSLVGKLMLKSCDNIMDWSSKPVEYKITNIEKINTAYNEIGPFPYKDGIIFTSEFKYLQDLNEKESKKKKDDDETETPSYSVYYVPFINGTAGEISSFFGRNSEDDYEGPAFLNSDETVVYYNKVFDTRKYLVNQIKLFISEYNNGVWGEPKAFHLNSNEYTITNPVLSISGDTLFFASDMEGGYGGMDIYYCVKTNGKWGKAINLGPLLNTDGIEIPSYFNTKKELFFSSNFHPGYGGFDIFKTKWDGNTWGKPVNLKSPLNSTKDDLGYIPVSKDLGYFSSNRDGGSGKDDIYRYGMLDTNDLSNYTKVSGVYEYEGLPLDNVTLNLLDENDVLIQTAVTNEKGQFEFNGIPPGANYQIIVDEDESKIPDGAKLYLTNSKNQKVRLLKQIRKGLFRFEALKSDEYDALPLMDEEDAEFNRLTILGEVYSKVAKQVPAGTEVLLMDDEKNVLAEAKTNEKGEFIFTEQKMLDQFLFRLSEDDPTLGVNILAENKELLASTTRDEEGNFVYLTNIQKTVKNPDVAGVFRYGTLPASDVQLNLMDENDDVLQKTRTNDKGEFRFTSLEAGTNYGIQVDPSEGKVPKNANLLMRDDKTGLLLPVIKSGRNSFQFKTLSYIEPEPLTLMNVEDEDSQLTNYSGEIYHTLSEDIPSDMKVYLLNKDGNIAATAIAKKNGEFKFEGVEKRDTLLMKLSESNSDLNLKIIDERGMLLGVTTRNKDGNYEFYTNLQKSVKNPDIAGVFKYGTLPASDVRLNLMDENDQELQNIRTDENGEFEFTNLNAGSKYSIEVDKSAGKIPNNARLFLKDKSSGAVLPVMKTGLGSFNFQTLPYDEPEELTLMNTEDENAVKMNLLGAVYHKLSMDVPEGLEVYILDDEGNIIATAKTTENGNFEFNDIIKSDSILLSLSQKDPNLELKIINRQGQLIGTTTRNNNGNFVYKTNLLKAAKNPDIAGVFKYGTLPANNVQLNLMDENDEMVQFTNTDDNGEFEFKKLSAGKKYSIEVDKSAGEVPVNAQILLKDKTTGQLLPVMKSGNSIFKFETLAYDEPEELTLMEVEDEDPFAKSFLSKLNYEKLPYDLAEGMNLMLVTEDDVVLSRAKVQKDGNFKFNSLEISNKQLDELKRSGKLDELRIVNSRGETIAKLEEGSGGKYLASLSGNPQKGTTKKLTGDENTIYFDFASPDLSLEAVHKIDNILIKFRSKNYNKIVVHTHTDSRGKEKYNEWLSQRRANLILQYLILEGVDYDKIEVKWHGEHQLANECDDNTPCSEKKHARNRRAEFELIAN